MAAAQAQAVQRRAEASAAYEERTRPLKFIKEFQDHNLAIMSDIFEPVASRVLAWVRRYAWGEWALFAIGVDGMPKYQVDCCRELGLKPRAVSKAVSYLQWRGYIEDQPKLLTPVVSPQMGGPAPDTEAKSPEWSAFCELWNVAHSADFEKLEVARATVDQIRKVRRADYKKWREQERKAAATLLETARQLPDPSAGSGSLTPFQESQQRVAAKKAQHGSVDGGMQSEVRNLAFSEIARMQHAYPNSSFGSDVIDPANPGHQNLVSLIFKKLGSHDEEHLLGFLLWIVAQFKGLGGKRKERRPGLPGGPEGLGLLVEWAGDYAQIDGDLRQREEQRLDELTESTFGKLEPAERLRQRAEARQYLKSTPQFRRLSPVKQDEACDELVRARLRQQLLERDRRGDS